MSGLFNHNEKTCCGKDLIEVKDCRLNYTLKKKCELCKCKSYYEAAFDDTMGVPTGPDSITYTYCYSHAKPHVEQKMKSALAYIFESCAILRKFINFNFGFQIQKEEIYKIIRENSINYNIIKKVNEYFKLKSYYDGLSEEKKIIISYKIYNNRTTTEFNYSFH